MVSFFDLKGNRVVKRKSEMTGHGRRQKHKPKIKRKKPVKKEVGIRSRYEKLSSTDIFKCQICGTEDNLDNSIKCQKCRTPIHPECAQFNNGKCATYGCDYISNVATTQRKAYNNKLPGVTSPTKNNKTALGILLIILVIIACGSVARLADNETLNLFLILFGGFAIQAIIQLVWYGRVENDYFWYKPTNHLSGWVFICKF